MSVSSVCPSLLFNHSVMCVLYKIYPTTFSPYSSTTTLNHRANLVIYVITSPVMLPNISKTGETTHDASFHATDSIMLLIRTVLMAVRS